MAEAISDASGIVTLVTFALQSNRALYSTVTSLQKPPRSIVDLIGEIKALDQVLHALLQAVPSSYVELAALELPLRRCGEACKEFDAIITRCSGGTTKSKQSFRDWARLKYLGDDVTGFQRMLASYRATICIALSDVNLRTTIITADALRECRALVDDTTVELEKRLETISKMLEKYKPGRIETSKEHELQNMEDQKDSTKECLEICSKVLDHVESAQEQATKSMSPASEGDHDHIAATQHPFSAQAIVANTFNDVRLRLDSAKTLLEKTLLEKIPSRPANDDEGSSQEYSAVDSSDTISVLSMDVPPSLTSASTASEMQKIAVNAAEEFADLLLEDEIMKNMFKDAVSKFGRERFKRNVFTLLKNFAMEIHSEAINRNCRAAARWIFSDANRVVYFIMGSLGLDEESSPLQGSITRSERSALIERFLKGAVVQEGQLIHDEQFNYGFDDDDDDDTQQVNLKEVKAFLIHSAAYQNLREGVLKFVNPSMRSDTSIKRHIDEEEPAHHTSGRDSKQVSHSFGREREQALVLLSRLLNAGKRILRPRVQPGLKRIEWICTCGACMYADIPASVTIDTEAKFLSHLNRSVAATQPTTTRNNFASTGVPTLAAFAGPSSTEQAPLKRFNPTSNEQHGGRAQPHNDPTVGNMATMKQSPYQRFFELCVNVNPLHISLGEIRLVRRIAGAFSDIDTDGEFFQLIHHQYYTLQPTRWKRWRRWLYKPVDIKFVRFHILHSIHKVGIFDEGSLSIPPESEVSANRYHYWECPMIPEEPMDRRTFFHFFWHYKKHLESDSNVWLNRMPKKLKNSLLSELQPNKLNVGWGVHIIEGPNKPVISLILAIVLVISFLVSMLWAVLRDTQESGFGIGQWIVATLSACFGALYFHISEN